MSVLSIKTFSCIRHGYAKVTQEYFQLHKAGSSSDTRSINILTLLTLSSKALRLYLKVMYK